MTSSSAATDRPAAVLAPSDRPGAAGSTRSPAWRRPLAFFALGCVLAGVLAWGLFGTGGSGSPNPSRVAPFTLPRLGGPARGAGSTVSYPLRGAGAGAPLVVTQFASWCSPCQSELPMIGAVSGALQAQHSPVRFLGIDVSDPDRGAGWSFAVHSGVGFPVAWDVDARFADSMHFLGSPDTVFVDRHGRVAHVVIGPLSRDVLVAWVARLSR